jgi:hypothetical protein
MKKRILSISLLTTLLASGCGTTNESGMSKLANLVSKAMPFVQESEEWETYSNQKTQQGVSYSTASTSDIQYISNRMDAEYARAVDRLSRPFASEKNLEKELDKANKNYHFKYNTALVVKDKSAATIGYCVNYDVTRWENGRATAPDADGNETQAFIYVAKDKPVSLATVDRDFIKKMCGTNFYNQNKNPNA